MRDDALSGVGETEMINTGDVGSGLRVSDIQRLDRLAAWLYVYVIVEWEVLLTGSR
jgi:hypothetical protein